MTAKIPVNGNADDEALEEPGQYASPPCYQHEIDPLYQGFPDGNRLPVDEVATGITNQKDWKCVKKWRQDQRTRLIALREKLSDAEREQASASIIRTLLDEFPCDSGHVGFYWPLPAEIDVRPWIRNLLANNIKAALPVIVEKNQPLEFWEWQPLMELETRGIWGIPTPRERRLVLPGILLVPLIGFDQNRHRLGHGGGYYDRTLATLRPAPVTIGVGYEIGRLATIYPQSHDIPMNAIITERGVVSRSSNPISAHQ